MSQAAHSFCLLCVGTHPAPMTKCAETGKTEAYLRCFIHSVLNEEVVNEQNTLFLGMNAILWILLFSVFMK